jgi:hypothetical protein
MSLTSYRAAPPRVRLCCLGGCRLCAAIVLSGERVRRALCVARVVWCFPVGRPGDDRLSRVLGRSTIGAEGFHGRVRNGIGCWAPRYDHQVVRPEAGEPCWSCSKEDGGVGERSRGTERSEAEERLRTLPRHDSGRIEIKPIERLGPVGSTHCCAFTPGLSTWWSSTALGRDLVLRGVSRLDAFSGYPVRT